jgi:hypothetical protein
MREEELAKRLQGAFPNIAPPDDTLHDRIQSLQSRAKRSRKKRATWKTVLSSTLAISMGAIVISRASVAYVLYRMENASLPRTTQIRAITNTTSSQTITQTYRLKDGKEYWTSYGKNLTTKKTIVFHNIIRDGKYIAWTDDREENSIIMPIAKIPKISVGNWLSRTFSIPWLIRLPDQIVDRKRQWVLQQIYIDYSSESQSQFMGKAKWGIDAQTSCIIWSDHSYAMNDGSTSGFGRSHHRNIYTHNTSIPDSLFEIPPGVKLIPSTNSYSLPDSHAFQQPFQQHKSEVSLRKWWDDILLGKS